MLYKYYQSSDEGHHKARKIDSDRKAAALIEEHLEREKREQDEKLRIYRSHHPEEFEDEEEEESAPTEGEEAEGEEDSSDFSPGLPVEMIDPADYASPEPEPENSQAAEEARALAEQIVAEAREQAAMVVQEAEGQADQIREQAREAGYSEGSMRAEEEKNAFMAEQEAALAAKLEEIENEKAAAVAALEPEMLDVMLKVFNKVFHIQFDDKKEILSYLVMNTIMGVEGSKDFRIKASNDNFPYLSAHLEEIKEQVGEEYHLEVVADGTIGENKCIIETDAGFFDCSLGVHLESLTKDLKSICLSST